MTKRAITIEFDDQTLDGWDDVNLAMLWHVAQANPADGFDNKEPGEITARVGLEIIRRWLAKAPVQLHHHQERHYYWKQLRKLGHWENGVFVPDAVPAADAAEESTGGDR